MIITVGTEKVIALEDFPSVLEAMYHLYDSFGDCAKLESGLKAEQMIEHARLMKKNLQLMKAAFYCYQEEDSLRAVLEAAVDDRVLAVVENHMKNRVEAVARLVHTAYGGPDPDLDYIWTISKCLAAYFRAAAYFRGQNSGKRKTMSSEELIAALAASENKAGEPIDLNEIDREAGLCGPE